MQENTVPAAFATPNIALLPPAQRAVIVLESTKTEVQLRELVALSADIVEVKDKAGRDQAHRAGITLKNARVGIEKIGKEARADARAFADAVVAEEKRLIAISQPEEARIMGLRDGYDAAEAAKKAELERIERERVQGIQAKIELIRALPHASINDSAAELAATIDDLAQLVPGIADFAEFCPDAAAARDTAVAALKVLHNSAVTREAEAARLGAERAELEKLRAEQEEKAAKLEADRIAFAKHQEESKSLYLALHSANDDAQVGISAPVTSQLTIDGVTIHGVGTFSIDPPSQINFDLASTPDETAVAAVDQGYVNILHPVAASVELLRSALRDALLTLSTVEIRAIVEDELAAAEAA